VSANADIDKRVPRFYFEAEAHLQALFGKPTEVHGDTDNRGMTTYNGQRLLSQCTHPTAERQADTHVCPTDPDVTPLHSLFAMPRSLSG